MLFQVALLLTKAVYILNSLDKFNSRYSLNGAELCKRINKYTHEIFHVVADVKKAIEIAKETSSAIILYSNPDKKTKDLFFLGHRDTLMPQKANCYVLQRTKVLCFRII